MVEWYLKLPGFSNATPWEEAGPGSFVIREKDVALKVVVTAEEDGQPVRIENNQANVP